MDLAVGAKQVFVMMSLFTNDGVAKLVPQCTYPLTAPQCVTRVYTDHATFVLSGGQVSTVETYGITHAELQQRLEVTLADELVHPSKGDEPLHENRCRRHIAYRQADQPAAT